MTSIQLQCAYFLLKVLKNTDTKMRSEIDNHYKYSIFCNDKQPNLSLIEFVLRINNKLKFSECNNIMAVALIEKALKLNADLVLNEFNIHKLFFAAVITACKMNEDNFCFDKDTCTIIGISPELGRSLIEEFLKIIEMNAFIDYTDYLRVSRIIINNNFYKLQMTDGGNFPIALLSNSAEFVL